MNTRFSWTTASIGTCALSLVLSHPGSVRAQDRFDVEGFQPAPAVAGSVLNVYGARTLAPRSYSVSVMGSYGHAPFSIDKSSGGSAGDVVGGVSTLQLMGAVGLLSHVDLGVAISMHRTAEGSHFAAPEANAAALHSPKNSFGDIRLVPRISLYEHSGASGFDAAVLAPVWLPTGKESAYAGEPVRVEPRLALDYHSKPVLVAFNAGYLIRSQAKVLGTQLDDLVKLGLGADIGMAGGLSALAEVDSQLNVLSKQFKGADADTELLLGLRYRSHGLLAQLGAGPGLVRGYTAPTYRAFASIGYQGSAAERDGDGDGLSDAQDRCPEQPEDKDGFEDRDGCPDGDNDGDGVADANDRCLGEAEDRDGFQDDDGCPDVDNDQDGVNDSRDKCAADAEDVDGFQDEDGCPDPDDDQDGVRDASDRCPREAGVAEAQGCPKPAEVAAAAPEPAQVQLEETLLFGKNSARITVGGAAQLSRIAQQLKQHPEIAHVTVDGHADDSGTAQVNARLSLERAMAVREALVAQGVASERLEAQGYGSSRPLVANDVEEHRARNRRVELRIAR